jgi:undecaprenyl-diphosphatase
MDPRPFVTQHVAPLFPHAPDNGFPSDHTLASMFLAVCALFYSTRWGGARIAAHVHSPIDILGAIALAIMAALITRPAARWLTARLSVGAADTRANEGD